MSRTFRTPGSASANSVSFLSQLLATSPSASHLRGPSGITALSIEFVAKPDAAHRVQGALPDAIHTAFEEVAGFAGGFVLVANYEARLVTVVTLWTGEERLQRCSDNLKWVRALLTPYLDRCLRVQTQAAYVRETRGALPELLSATEASGAVENEGVAVYAA